MIESRKGFVEFGLKLNDIQINNINEKKKKTNCDAVTVNFVVSMDFCLCFSLFLASIAYNYFVIKSIENDERVHVRLRILALAFLLLCNWIQFTFIEKYLSSCQAKNKRLNLRFESHELFGFDYHGWCSIYIHGCSNVCIFGKRKQNMAIKPIESKLIVWNLRKETFRNQNTFFPSSYNLIWYQIHNKRMNFQKK